MGGHDVCLFVCFLMGRQFCFVVREFQRCSYVCHNMRSLEETEIWAGMMFVCLFFDGKAILFCCSEFQRYR